MYAFNWLLVLRDYRICLAASESGPTRAAPPTLALHKILNYTLRVLYMRCQWKMLPIERNAEGRP